MEPNTTGPSCQLTVLTALAAVFPLLGSLLLREGVVPWGETYQPPEDMTRFLMKLRPLTFVVHHRYTLQPWVDVSLYIGWTLVFIGVLYGLFVWCHFGTRERRKKISTYMAVIVPLVTVGLFVITACLFRFANAMLKKPGLYVGQNEVLRRMKLNVENPKTLSVWNKPQIALKCCGLGGYTDWTGTKQGTVPDSCFRIYKPGCGRNFTLNNIYRTGCDVKLADHIEDQYYIQTRNQQNAFHTVSIVFLTWAILITFFSVMAWCDHSWSEIL